MSQEEKSTDALNGGQPNQLIGQLLPPRFFVHRRARRVLSIWGFIILSLTTVLGAVLVPVWVRGQRIRLANSRLAKEAAPLADLKKKSALLRAEYERQSKWASWVETATPDDSLLQTVAAIAQATDPTQTGIKVDLLVIRLPLEYPQVLSKPPRWALPSLDVTARVSNDELAKSWLERINDSQRIDTATQKLTSGLVTAGTVQVTGKPLSTRVVP